MHCRPGRGAGEEEDRRQKMTLASLIWWLSAAAAAVMNVKITNDGSILPSIAAARQRPHQRAAISCKTADTGHCQPGLGWAGLAGSKEEKDGCWLHGAMRK